MNRDRLFTQIDITSSFSPLHSICYSEFDISQFVFLVFLIHFPLLTNFIYIDENCDKIQKPELSEVRCPREM